MCSTAHRGQLARTKGAPEAEQNHRAVLVGTRAGAKHVTIAVTCSSKSGKAWGYLCSVRAGHAALEQANAGVLIGTRQVALGVGEPDSDPGAPHSAQLLAAVEQLGEVARQRVAARGLDAQRARLAPVRDRAQIPLVGEACLRGACVGDVVLSARGELAQRGGCRRDPHNRRSPDDSVCENADADQRSSCRRAMGLPVDTERDRRANWSQGKQRSDAWRRAAKALRMHGNGT